MPAHGSKKVKLNGRARLPTSNKSPKIIDEQLLYMRHGFHHSIEEIGRWIKKISQQLSWIGFGDATSTKVASGVSCKLTCNLSFSGAMTCCCPLQRLQDGLQCAIDSWHAAKLQLLLHHKALCLGAKDHVFSVETVGLLSSAGADTWT